MNNMKTLVIHPKDSTTDFLSGIYADKPDWNILNYDCSSSYIKLQIAVHDRIIIMGHGIPAGLLGHGKLFIHSDFVYLLRDIRKQYVFIWCNADLFVEEYNLHGFYSGMFISEMAEAAWFHIDATEEQIDYSNKLFAEAVNKSIDRNNFYDRVKLEYDNIQDQNPIIEYNKQRLYFR